MTRATTTLFALIAMGSGMFACSCEGGTSGSSTTAPTSSIKPPSTASSVSVKATTTATATSAPGPAGPQLKVIARFKPADNELPEGVTVSADGKTAYVGFGPSGKIVKVSLPGGEVTPFGGLAKPPPDGELLLGLILDAKGTLYAGVSGKAKGGAGVYQFDASGAPTLVADDKNMTFPNGLVFAKDGSLLVTDSKAGAVFKVDIQNKKATQWAASPLLEGAPAPGNPCAEGLPSVPVGANGIAIVGDNAYVANVHKATVVKIPIKADGSADKPVEFANPGANCAPLRGADGIVPDTDGSLLFVGNTGNTLGRIGPDGKSQVILTGGEIFDFPASISIATVDGARYAIITNFAIATKAKPALLSYGPLK
jgi:sugar lactone lactonase YvrE